MIEGRLTEESRPQVEREMENCGVDEASSPRQEIRDLLHEEDIQLKTTKTSDVIVRSIGDHTGVYEVINLKAKSTEISSTGTFVSKKVHILDANGDALRQRYGGRRRYPR